MNFFFKYLTKILRKYFNCNNRLEIFSKFFCVILCYVSTALEVVDSFLVSDRIRAQEHPAELGIHTP